MRTAYSCSPHTSSEKGPAAASVSTDTREVYITFTLPTSPLHCLHCLYAAQTFLPCRDPAISAPAEEGRADPSIFHTFVKLFLQQHSTPLHCHGVLTKGTSQQAPPPRLTAAAGWDVLETAPTWSLATRTCLVEPPAHVGAQEQVSRWWDQPRGTCSLSSGKVILSPKTSCAATELHMGQQGLAQQQGARDESRSP